MYQVLIVDDEESIRHGLTNLVDWYKLGFHVCGTAENGLAALSIIEESHPDLILLDIKMPVFDGLKLMHEIKKRNLYCKIIVLSGYSEFEYARQALEFGAKTYMLKPVDTEQLSATVSLIRMEIERDQESSRNIPVTYEHACRNIAIQLLNNRFSTYDFERHNQQFNFRLPWEDYRLIVTISDSENKIHQIFQTFCQSKIYSIPFNYGRYEIILCGNSRLEEFQNSHLELLNKQIELECGQRYLLVAGNNVDTPQQLMKSLLSIERILYNPFLFKNKPYVIIDHDTHRESDAIKQINNELVSRFVTTIKNGSAQQRLWLLEAQRDNFIRRITEEIEIKAFYSELLTRILDHPDITSVKPAVRPDYWRTIQGFDNLDSIHDFVKLELQELSNLYTNNLPDDKIIEIIRFIEHNYTEPSLSLKTLSEKYSYHPTYLGVILKKQLGKSFNQYLLELRLEYAKRLLQNGQKPSLTAVQAGFNDAEYFRKLFKQEVGISPSRYYKSAKSK